jgi:hypothetical protein
MVKRRKTKSLPPKDKKPKVSRPDPLDSMSAPNHNPILLMTKVPGSSKVSSSRYPLMHIHKSEDGAGTTAGLAFVDDQYECKNWPDRDDKAPPTWMDPEIFARMCAKDTKIKEIAARYIKKGDSGKLKAMTERVQEVFEEEYLPYVLEQFSDAGPLVAEWMTALFAARSEDKKLKA